MKNVNKRNKKYRSLSGRFKNNSMKNSFKFCFLILTIVFISCSKDGEVGPKGTDGTDGVNGIDGVDGNANVTTYLFNEPEWGSSGSMRLDMTGVLTTEVVTNDVILVYVRRNTGNNSKRVFQIPGWVHGSFPNFPTQMMTPYFNDSEGGAGGSGIPESVYVSSRTIDNVGVPVAELIPLEWIKVIIIKSANTINGKSSKDITPKDSVLNELKTAGVNINDYYAVCEYYGIAPQTD